MSEVTNVTIRKVNGDNGLVGFAQVVVNDDLVLNDIAIRKKDDNVFISEPTGKKYQDKEGKDVYPKYFHPITAEFRRKLNKAIIDKYNEG